jgi:hypothetical protein
VVKNIVTITGINNFNSQNEGGITMITDKLDMLKHEICQKEIILIVEGFRQALRKHFEVVNANSTRLINSRWGDNNAVSE